MVRRPGLNTRDRPRRRRRPRRRLSRIASQLATGGPGPRPGAGCAGERAARRRAHRRQPDRRAIKFPHGVSLYAPQTLDTIAEVHRALEDQAGVGNVWSVETLRRWLAQKLGKNDVDTLKAICRRAAEISGAALRGRKTGCGDRLRPSSRQGCLRLRADRRQLNAEARCGAREAPRLHHRADRPLGDRRAQQRRHDQQAQSRADDRIRLPRQFHRPRVPVASGDVGEPVARHISRSRRRALCCGFWARAFNSPASSH